MLSGPGNHISLLERDLEFNKIESCLRQAGRGAGVCLAIEGLAGTGKTALLSAARHLPEAEGFRWLRARGAELEREYAFGVVRQLFEPVLGTASEQQRVSLLDGPAGAAAALLGLPRSGSDARVDPPVMSDASFAVLHGLYWLCVTLAAEGPLALVIDDAHWADTPSLRFLGFLLPRLQELRVAALFAARPPERADSQELITALLLDPETVAITTRPLTIIGVSQLIEGGLDAEVEPLFAAACWEATGGTPFLVHTLISALRDRGIRPVAASSALVPEMATSTLGRWAKHQIGRIGPNAARVASAVAILEQGELREVARLAGLDVSEAADVVDLLVQLGLFEMGALRFAHPLLRSAVYRGIGAAERSEAHRRAARDMAGDGADPAHVAQHLLAADPAGEVWVVEYLVSAAVTASSRGAPDSAVSYLRRALAEPPSPEARAGLLLQLGQAEWSSGQEGWEDHLKRAVDAASGDSVRVAATLSLALAFGGQNRQGEAVEACDRVVGRLENPDRDTKLLLETTAVVNGLANAASADLVADRAAQLVELAEADGAPGYVVANAAMLAAHANRPSDQVASLAHRALRDSAGLNADVWSGLFTIALVYAERFSEALLLLDHQVTDDRAAANLIMLGWNLSLRAALNQRKGDLTAAEADARALIDAPEISKVSSLHRALAGSVLALVLVERDQLGEAERELARFDLEIEGSTSTSASLRHARGKLRYEQGAYSEALDDFLTAGDNFMKMRIPSPCILPWRSDAALCHLALGAMDEARFLAEEELALARTFGAPRCIGLALRGAALVEGSQRGEQLLRDAVEILDGDDTRLEQARALTDLGALLRRGNRRADARPLLRQALDSAHHIGATALANRAETELRATGARPRRVLLTGFEALTASERRIAEFAAKGQSNREIAQALFVTPRTVETHLTHVFQKLTVRTRTELAGALATATFAGRS